VELEIRPGLTLPVQIFEDGKLRAEITWQDVPAAWVVRTANNRLEFRVSLSGATCDSCAFYADPICAHPRIAGPVFRPSMPPCGGPEYKRKP
jgi:hypothetical protein